MLQQKQPQERSPQLLQQNCNGLRNSHHSLNNSRWTKKVVEWRWCFTLKPGWFCFSSILSNSYSPNPHFSYQYSILVLPTWYYCSSTLVISKQIHALQKALQPHLWREGHCSFHWQEATLRNRSRRWNAPSPLAVLLLMRRKTLGSRAETRCMGIINGKILNNTNLPATPISLCQTPSYQGLQICWTTRIN